MSCATCGKNEICLVKKDPNEFRGHCSVELRKACKNCNKAETCTDKTADDGYCKNYRSMYAKSILFPGENSGGGILL